MANHAVGLYNSRMRLVLLAGAIAIVVACGQTTLEPLPLDISLQASRTTAAAGDTIAFVATVQGGSLLGLDADYGDSTTDQFAAGGARTGKVTFLHAYRVRGTYTTTITVTDATASRKSSTIQIRVN